MATARACTACGTLIPFAGVFHRVRLIVEGEQDLAEVLLSPTTESPEDALAAAVEAADWDRLAHDVHEELRGEVCGRCRRLLIAAATPFAAEPAITQET